MSLLCPIDFRYGRPKMKSIFEEEARLQRLLEVEAALARAEAKVGLVPREAAAEITKKATTKQVTVRRVEELEKQTRHDLMAVVLALTEACSGDAGKYVHLGATSNDIQDSATALQIRDAIRGLAREVLHGGAQPSADGNRGGRGGVRRGVTGREFHDGEQGEPDRLGERLLPRPHRAVPRHPGAGGRPSLARTRPDEQRRRADL